MKTIVSIYEEDVDKVILTDNSVFIYTQDENVMILSPEAAELLRGKLQDLLAKQHDL
jgi:TFIIF-interacting CTD phosphatase-like protein